MLRQAIFLGLVVTVAEAAVAGLPDLSGLPACASTAAASGISATGCQLTDFECICASSVFIKAVGTQIAASCNAEDQKKALAFANSICQQNGVTVPSDGLAVSSAAAAAAAPAATEEAKEVPSATESVAADATETGAADEASAETSSSEPPYPVPSGNGTNSTSTSNSTSSVAPFAGAGSKSGIAIQGVVVGLLVAGGFALI